MHIPHPLWMRVSTCAASCARVCSVKGELCTLWTSRGSQMCERVGLSPGEARCEGSQPLQNQCLCMSGLMEGPHQLHREVEEEEEEEEGDEGREARGKRGELRKKMKSE